jgi:uncharacterized protein YndB with AHSA1/START domain
MDITWPEAYRTDNTPIHVSNELEIEAPPEVIWEWLVQASLWPDWYPPIKSVVIEQGRARLEQGTKFSWRIFGVTLSSRVEEFVPNERLAWSAKYEGVDAYHAWLIEKKSASCRVLTEENQKGWLARLNNLFRPSNVSYYHSLWLQALRSKSMEGYPAALPTR